MSLLSARGLSKRFRRQGDTVTALDGIDLDIAAGETLALVGPSGRPAAHPRHRRADGAAALDSHAAGARRPAGDAGRAPHP